MSKKLFLDTNILIDMALPDRPDHLAAMLLANEISSSAETSGYVCATSLKDLYYVLTKCGTESDARNQVLDIFEFAEISPVNETICRRAARSNEPDFEDGIIRACAEVAGVDFIISRDEGAFARSYIKRLSARDYVDLFCETHEVDL